MRINRMWGTLIVLLALTLVVFGGCKAEEEDDGSIVGTISAPAITAAGTWDSTAFGKSATIKEAKQLLDDFSNSDIYTLRSMLYNADKQTFDDRFAALNNQIKPGPYFWAWGNDPANMSKKSLSITVGGINDQGSLVEKIGDVKAGSIKGSNSASIGLSKNFLVQYFAINNPNNPTTAELALLVDETVSRSVSSTREIAITGGFVNTGNFKVSGTIKTEYKSNSKSTLKSDQAAITTRTGSSNSVSKVAVALTISDGDKAAKFRFSISNDSNSSSRGTDGYGSSNCTDIEVFDQAGPIGTIKANDLNSNYWTNLASSFTYGPEYFKSSALSLYF